jgi:hypothetical protein
MSNEEDYSDMPALIYDDTPIQETTPTTNEAKPVKPSLSVETNTDNGDEDDNKNGDEDEEDDDDNEEDDNKNEEDEDEEEEENEIDNDENDVVSDDDDMFVLTDENMPVRCSTDYHALCRYRDHLVQKETRRFHDNGAIYVSHNKQETVLSYKDRNLIWNTERILKTFTIHRINKI